MLRTKNNSYYLMVFAAYTFAGYVLTAIIEVLTGFRVPASGLLIPMLAASLTSAKFSKHERRLFHKKERSTFVKLSLLITVLMNLIFVMMAYFAGTFEQLAQAFPKAEKSVVYAIIGFGILLSFTIQYFILRLGYSERFAKKTLERELTKSPKRTANNLDSENEEAPAIAANMVSQSGSKESEWQPVSEQEWSPVNDGSSAGSFGRGNPRIRH